MGLQISIRKSGDVTILDLQGRATIGVDSELLSAHLKKLVARGERRLLLNLRDMGGELKFLCPCGRVLEVFTVLRLPEIIPSFADETQAVASFRPQHGYAARP